MYLCVKGIDFVSSYDFDIWIWNCSVSVVFVIFQLIIYRPYIHYTNQPTISTVNQIKCTYL